MKKTDWTDRMLAALVELYPVETTAYTAAVLNLSESTVKLKARELGLVKMAKSKWMERADYIRNHFQECSFSEIGKALGITRMSVGRIAAALGLKRSSEEKHLISSRIRTQMVKRERRRIVFGLEPVTGIRVISNRAKVRVRSNMKSNGYIISEYINDTGFKSGVYGYASAMSMIYFLIIGIFIAIVFLLTRKKIFYYV